MELTTIVVKSSATLLAIKWVWSIPKMGCFREVTNYHQTNGIAKWRGKLTRKSTDMSSQTWVGCLMGCNNSSWVVVRYFVCWNTWHFETKSMASFLMPSQLKLLPNLLNVLYTLAWPPVSVLWYSSGIVDLNGQSWFNNNLPLRYRSPVLALRSGCAYAS